MSGGDARSAVTSQTQRGAHYPALGYCCRSRCIRFDIDGSLEDDADVPIVGFSATFSRHDTLALSAVFEEIVFHRDVGYMLEEGWCVVR